MAPNGTNPGRRRQNVLFPTYAQFVLYKMVENLFKTVDIDSEPEECSLASTKCNIFPCQQKFLYKIPTGLLKHVHFSLDVDDPL